MAENTYDLGEYLAYLHNKGELSTDFGPVPGRIVYYPPCHLREQEIGLPYMELLKMIPGITLETISGAFYCCGLAGVMGFKREFHETSVKGVSKIWLTNQKSFSFAPGIPVEARWRKHGHKA